MVASRRSKGASILLELKDILDNTGIFNDVSFDKIKGIDEITTFDSCSIIEEKEVMEFNSRNTTKVDGYTRSMFILLHISLLMKYELGYKDVQEKVERAILDDSKIWGNTGIQDRDILDVNWDLNDHFDLSKKVYKKQGLMRFEFRYRICPDENII